jgi:hypothetical protein
MAPRSVHSAAIAEVKQRWSVITWVTKNLLSQPPRCFGKHVKSLVPAALAVASTYLSRDPFFLCVIHKEGLCSAEETLIG